MPAQISIANCLRQLTKPGKISCSNTPETKMGLSLKQLIDNSGKSCTEIAFRCSVTEQTIKNWVKGRYAPKISVSTCRELTKVLNCTLDELCEAVERSCQKV